MFRTLLLRGNCLVASVLLAVACGADDVPPNPSGQDAATSDTVPRPERPDTAASDTATPDTLASSEKPDTAAPDTTTSDAVAPPQAGISPTKLAALNAYVDDQVKAGRLHGAVTLIQLNGQQVQLKAHGMMDIENKVPMRTDAIFRLASITKLAAAVGTLTLVDEGKFSLDRPVSQFLPEFAAPVVLTSPTKNANGTWQTAPVTRAITIRDLLRHTAGFQYGFGLNDLDKEYLPFANAWKAPLSKFITDIAKLPLAYQPGTQFSYSYSIDVLGRVMEVVSGLPLDQFFAAKVFGPLRMVDTGFVVPGPKVPRLSGFYASAGGVLTLREAGATSQFLTQPMGLSAGGGWETGYGGIVTTATDYARLLQMLLNKGQIEGTRVLSAASVDEIIKDQLIGVAPGARFPALTGASSYGLGLGVEENANAPGKPLVYWTGAPYNTSVFADFEAGQVGILLTQSAPFVPRTDPAGIHTEFRGKARAAVLDPGSNKEIAIAALTAFTNKDAAALPLYFDAGFIRHSPTAKSDGLAELQAALSSGTLGGKWTFYRAFEKGDLVVVHGKYDDVPRMGDSFVAFDLFRFQNKKIVEHWDCLQKDPGVYVSGHTMVDGPADVDRGASTTVSEDVVVTPGKGFVPVVLVGGAFDKLASYLGAYIQHDPLVGDGPAGLNAAIMKAPLNTMHFVKVHKFVSDRDFVFVRSQGTMTWDVQKPGSPDNPTVFCDLFRVKNNKLEEHWDVIQLDPNSTKISDIKSNGAGHTMWD